MTLVTSAWLSAAYLLFIGSRLIRRESQMTKFYALIAACALFAPMAFATLNQAALMIV